MGTERLTSGVDYHEKFTIPKYMETDGRMKNTEVLQDVAGLENHLGVNGQDRRGTDEAFKFEIAMRELSESLGSTLRAAMMTENDDEAIKFFMEARREKKQISDAYDRLK